MIVTNSENDDINLLQNDLKARWAMTLGWFL